MTGVAQQQAGLSPATHSVLQSFLDHLVQQRRLSAATRRNYATDLHGLLQLYPDKSLQQFTALDIRRAVASLHGRGLQPRTLARMLSAWRSCFDWMARHHGLSLNPCSGVRAPKSARLLPKALSPDAALQLLDQSLAQDDGLVAQSVTGSVNALSLRLRDQAMFELLYSSGLRLAELVSLDLAHCREMQAEGQVTVTGKGARRRSVPVGGKALQALQAWLAQRARCARPEEVALFVGSQGRRINPGVVRASLAHWAQQAGLTQHVHPHVLRHSFASHVLQSSGDLRAVQEMLGHASVATTQIYTSLDFQHLAKVYDQAHPRARRKPDSHG
jgi:integrase/recombinase XerC